MRWFVCNIAHIYYIYIQQHAKSNRTSSPAIMDGPARL